LLAGAKRIRTSHWARWTTDKTHAVRPIARYDHFASSLSWEETMLKKLVFCAALAAGLCGTAALAQQDEPIRRTELQRLDSPGDKMATLLMLIEIAPNALVPKHTHPGGEVGYVLDGTGWGGGLTRVYAVRFAPS
jgi:hypothetical protein